MSNPKYPEHEKLRAVSAKTQFVHDFLMFCEEKGISLQTESGVYKRHADLLYEFTGIDQWKLEAEKRALIEEANTLVKKVSEDSKKSR